MNINVLDLPDRPFFSCEKSYFLIIDSNKMRDVKALDNLEPLFKFEVGPGNVFESSPKFEIEHTNTHVHVACEGEQTVILDFEDLAASRESQEGRYLYKGGLDQSNDGLGFMKAI